MTALVAPFAGSRLVLPYPSGGAAARRRLAPTFRYQAANGRTDLVPTLHPQRSPTVSQLPDFPIEADRFEFTWPCFTYILGPSPAYFRNPESGRIFGAIWTDEDLYQTYMSAK